MASETLTGVTQSKIEDVCLFIYLLASERSERDTLRGITQSRFRYIYLSASERRERDTYRGNTIENRGCLFIYWRASVASETISGVDNAKSGICYMYICIYVCMYGLYVCMDCTYAPRAGGTFFLKKHGFLGLTPVYSETTALSKPYFILKLQSVRKLLRKCLLFKKQKVDSTGYYDIEDPLPDLYSKLRLFYG